MTRLLRLLFFVPPILAGMLLIWAVLRRMTPVRLRPTADSTAPLGRADIQPGIRRIILSDLHLGAGDHLDDFNADAELIALLQTYGSDHEPTELILAGDTFEFLQVRLPDIPDSEWSARAAARRLEVIIRAHRGVILGLKQFLAGHGNQLTVLIGNHDFELHYAAAKQALRHALGLTDNDPRLRFGSRYEGDGIYLIHGNQYDRWNRFVYFDGICEPFEVVLGTRLIREAINDLEEEPLAVAPLIDNIKPLSAMFWYALALPNLRNSAMRRLAARSLVLLINVFLRNEHYTLARNAPPRLPLAQIRRGIATIATAIIRAAGLRQVTAGSDDWRTFQHEAKQQAYRSTYTMQRTTSRGMAHLARDPRRRQISLFICGHTHLAQIAALNARQTYINTGTWTDVIFDITTARRQQQRFPFLEIRYAEPGAPPDWQLLVWQGAHQPPQKWRDTPSSVAEHAEYPV